mmetsp:Transcript_11245/g.18308  ORF Transcript_11245/g.18308 Transcript_11245/m.18308 type:complete len:115 (+) Transcript_11245:48-392(+)
MKRSTLTTMMLRRMTGSKYRGVEIIEGSVVMKMVVSRIALTAMVVVTGAVSRIALVDMVVEKEVRTIQLVGVGMEDTTMQAYVVMVGVDNIRLARGANRDVFNIGKTLLSGCEW